MSFFTPYLIHIAQAKGHIDFDSVLNMIKKYNSTSKMYLKDTFSKIKIEF